MKKKRQTLPSPSGPQFGAAKSQERKEIQSLCEISENFQTIGIKGVQTSRSILATVREISGTAQANSLEIDSKRLASALDKLHDNVEKVSSYLEEIDSNNSSQQIAELENEIDIVIHNIQEGRDANQGLSQPPASTSSNLGLDGRELARAMAMFISSVTKGELKESAQAGQETAQALRSMVSTVRGLNLETEDKLELALATKQVISKSIELFEAAQQALHYPNQQLTHKQLLSTGKEVSKAIFNCIQFTPGQKELDKMAKSLNTDTISAILENRYVDENGNLQNGLSASDREKVNHKDVREKAENLNKYIDKVYTLPEKQCQTSQLVNTISDVSKASLDLTVVGSAYCDNKKLKNDPENLVVKSIKDSAECTSKLILAAKAFATDTNNDKSRGNLIEAAKLGFWVVVF